MVFSVIKLCLITHKISALPMFIVPIMMPLKPDYDRALDNRVANSFKLANLPVLQMEPRTVVVHRLRRLALLSTSSQTPLPPLSLSLLLVDSHDTAGSIGDIISSCPTVEATQYGGGREEVPPCGPCPDKQAC